MRLTQHDRKLVKRVLRSERVFILARNKAYMLGPDGTPWPLRKAPYADGVARGLLAEAPGEVHVQVPYSRPDGTPWSTPEPGRRLVVTEQAFLALMRQDFDASGSANGFELWCEAARLYLNFRP